VRAAHQVAQGRRRPGARFVATALRVRGQDFVHPIPDPAVDDWLVLAGVAHPFVHGLADIGTVAQDLVQRARIQPSNGRPSLSLAAGGPTMPFGNCRRMIESGVRSPYDGAGSTYRPSLEYVIALGSDRGRHRKA
jgi:hypothetical protein